VATERLDLRTVVAYTFRGATGYQRKGWKVARRLAHCRLYTHTARLSRAQAPTVASPRQPGQKSHSRRTKGNHAQCRQRTICRPGERRRRWEARCGSCQPMRSTQLAVLTSSRTVFERQVGDDPSSGRGIASVPVPMRSRQSMSGPGPSEVAVAVSNSDTCPRPWSVPRRHR